MTHRGEHTSGCKSCTRYRDLVAAHRTAGLTLVEAVEAADRGDPHPLDWEANVHGS